MLTDVTRKLFALQQLKGVGPSTLERLVATPNFLTASNTELATRSTKLAKALEPSGAWEDAVHAAQKNIDAAFRLDARIICVLDEEYPVLLKSTADRPFFLYVRGKLPQQSSRSVAVIGTRHPTEHGKLIAERISDFLAADGWSIVSGLAIGCDAIAHRTALARGGHTVAVMAHGLQTVAPKQHESLANEILERGGALITEYAFGVEPFPHQFVKRDRIQAGLAQGVVMIQSDLVGGSLHASRAAIAYQRVLAVPSPTERDIAAKELKIEANRVLSGSDVQEKAQLLKCTEADLERIVIMRNRDDYAILSRALATAIQKSGVPIAQHQNSLLSE